LGLRYFVLANFEGFCDLDEVSRLFVGIAAIVAGQAAHGEFPGCDPDELNRRRTLRHHWQQNNQRQTAAEKAWPRHKMPYHL
jgi:hypothetical protein